jgi:hypothetical protein
MHTPTTATITVTRDEAMVLAAHLKIQARRLENAADDYPPNMPPLPPHMMRMLKTHSAVYDNVADRLYGAFLDQADATFADEASDIIAKELRDL